MSEESEDVFERSYGCSFGCGNPYDFVLVDVASAETQFLCTMCFMRIASQMITAMVDANDPQVVEAMAYALQAPAEQVPGPRARKRGKNPPVGTTDPGVFEAYDGVITTEDLPDEFR